MELLIDPSVIFSIEATCSRRFRILAVMESYNPNNLEIFVNQIPSLRSTLDPQTNYKEPTRFSLYYIDANSVNAECTCPGSLVELEAICSSVKDNTLYSTSSNVILYRISPIDPDGFSNTEYLEVLKQMATTS